jgi:hypothetical protein
MSTLCQEASSSVLVVGRSALHVPQGDGSQRLQALE